MKNTLPINQKVKIETACQCRVSASAALEHSIKNALTVVPNALTIDVQQEQTFHFLLK